MGAIKLEEIPTWSRKALQGITFWIGHRRALYDHYPLGESAFVAELCNLIFAHLDKDHVLECEMSYSKIAGKAHLPSIIGPKARADIVVLRKGAKGAEPVPAFVIEVKRGSASQKEIDNDLKRLAAINSVNTSLRTMLFVVCEAKRHGRFVSAEGQSIRGLHQIPDDAGHFRVRRTFKAAHAFKTRDTAQYASLVEVFAVRSQSPS